MEKLKFGYELATARFALVVVIEILALAGCSVPLLSPKKSWQRDCLKVGAAASIIALVMCVLGFCVIALAPKSDRDTLIVFLEGGIVALYVFNVLALTLVTARTGGPTSSLYGTLIPVQLSALLFLQFEKDRLVGESSTLLALCYFFVAAGGYLIAHFASPKLRSLSIFASGEDRLDYIAAHNRSMVWLTVLGMALSLLTYLVPTSDRFAAVISQWYGKS